MTHLTISEYQLAPFDISAKEVMEKYLSHISTRVSDYTFASNFIWLSNASGFYTIINNTFCLFILSGGALTMLLPPIGKKEDVDEAILESFRIMNENNSSVHYSRIDYVCEEILEGFVSFLDPEAVIFDVFESYLVEKKLLDYVYLADDLIGLRGKSYNSKRNEINKFRKAYPQARIETLDPACHAESIVMLFNKWVADRIKYMPKEDADVFLDGIYLERMAIKRMLQYYEKLKLIGLVILLDEELIGFTVGEKMNGETASILIEKTDFEVLGCAQYIFREFCKVLKSEYGSVYINVGDDMGFENLRKVKMSYRPDSLVPKYTIYQK